MQSFELVATAAKRGTLLLQFLTPGVVIVCMGMGEQPEDEDAVELTRVVVSLVDSDWGERMIGTALSGLSELWQPATKKGTQIQNECFW